MKKGTFLSVVAIYLVIALVCTYGGIKIGKAEADRWYAKHGSPITIQENTNSWSPTGIATGITGTTAVYSFTSQDNLQIVVHDEGATSSLRVMLPTSMVLRNPTFLTSYCNDSPFEDQVEPMGGAAIDGYSTLIVPPKTCWEISPDPRSNTEGDEALCRTRITLELLCIGILGTFVLFRMQRRHRFEAKLQRCDKA